MREHPDYFDPDGLCVFIGPQGSGKTLSAVQYVQKLLSSYPKCILVSNLQLRDYPVISFEDWMVSHPKSNYDEYLHQNRVFPFNNNDDFLIYKNQDRGVIFLVDEIQLYLNSLESKNINLEVITQLSQQRKQRLHIVCTSQVFGRMAKPVREQFSCVILLSPIGCSQNIYDNNGTLYMSPGSLDFTPPSGDDSGGSGGDSSGGSTTWGEEEQAGFIEGIVNGIRDAILSIFIPEDGYFEEWMERIKNTFDGKTSLLSYPLSLLIDFVDTVATLGDSEPILSLPDVYFMGHLLIPAMSYNFNSLLQNETLAGIHSIYFIVIKALLAFELLKLIGRKFSEFGA